jgi:ankyrin repeat protein
LQIDQLFRLTLIKDIKSRLGKLPKDLKVAYDEIFDAMTEGEIEIVDRAFRWVMCACEPLTTDALLPAVCQDGEGEGLQPVDNLQESDLLHCCRNLLVIDNKRNVWIPAHLSVIEYIENHRWNQYQANCLVASVCLSLLIDPLYGNREQDSETENDAMGESLDGNSNSQSADNESSDGSSEDQDELLDQGNRKQDLEPENGSMNESLDDYSNSESAENESTDGSSDDQDQPLDQDFDDLREYARFHWMVHVRNCENGKSDRLSALLKQFLGSPNHSSSEYKSWYEHLDKRKDRRDWPQTSLLSALYDLRYRIFVPHSSAYAICAFGFYNTLLDWWGTPWELVTRPTDSDTSLLQAAAMGNNISICNRLITWGTDLNEQLRHSAWDNALVAAVICSDLAIVELFIEKGAEVDIQVQDNGNYGSALVAAAANGAEEKIKLLIEYGANVNMQLENGKYHGSALAAAAWDDHKGAVELLIQSGADVNMQLQYGDYGSALAAAAFGDYIELVKLLIESGAEVNMQLQLGDYGSALAVAAYWNSTEQVKLLIESGAEVNMQLQHGDYGSALAVAAYWNSTEQVKLLIESGAEVNMQLQHGDYGSALVAAAREGVIETVELLLKFGAEVNMQFPEKRYKNALAAAKQSYMASTMVELLMEHGAIELE